MAAGKFAAPAGRQSEGGAASAGGKMCVCVCVCGGGGGGGGGDGQHPVHIPAQCRWRATLPVARVAGSSHTTLAAALSSPPFALRVSRSAGSLRVVISRLRCLWASCFALCGAFALCVSRAHCCHGARVEQATLDDYVRDHLPPIVKVVRQPGGERRGPCSNGRLKSELVVFLLP